MYRLASISISNSTFSDSPGGITRRDVRRGRADQQHVHQRPPSGVSVVSDTNAVVSGNTFTGTGDQRALIVISAGTLTVQDNTISGSGAPTSRCAQPRFCGPTLTLAAQQLDLGQVSGNSGSGNIEPSIGLSGTLVASGSLGAFRRLGERH